MTLHTPTKYCHFVFGRLIGFRKTCGYTFLLCGHLSRAAVVARGSHLSVLCLVIAVSCTVIGCGSVESSDSRASSVRIAPKEVPLYLVDDLDSERIHSCSGVLNNEGAVPRVYIFKGVTCGCLAGEHDGKELIKGDRIRVAAGDAEEVVLRTRLGYMEGFYSDSAFFQSADDPSRRVAVESQYSVVRRLRLSPGALVFEREEARGPFTADATVRFRSSGNDGRDHKLSVANLPKPIHWSVKQESQGVKERLSPASEWFYEDEWTVLFRIDSDAHLGPSLPPHAEIDFVVFDGQGEEVARRSLPYNAECVGR